MPPLIETDRRSQDGRPLYLDPKTGVISDLRKPPPDYKIVGIAQSDPRRVLIKDEEGLVSDVSLEALDISPEAMESLRSLYSSTRGENSL